MNELDEWRTTAYENSRIYKDMVKRYHDQNVKQNEKFEEGKKVLLYNARLHLLPQKLKSQWSGTYLITNVSPQGVVKIHHQEKGLFKVNGYRLKPYFGKISIPPYAPSKISSIKLS